MDDRRQSGSWRWLPGRSWLLLSVPMLYGFYGCGGEDDGGAFTLTGGSFFSVDGQSASLAGIEVMAPDTGAVALSDAGGSLDLGSLPARFQGLEIRVPDGAGGFRLLASDVDLSAGGSSHLGFAVDGDRLLVLSQTTCGDHGDDAKMRRAFDGDGHVEVEKRGDGRERLTIRVEGNDLLPGDTLVVRFLRGSEMEDHATVVEMDGDEDGPEAELDFRPQERGDALPFGAGSVVDLALVDVFVLRGGAPLRSGAVPRLPSTVPCERGGGEDLKGRSDFVPDGHVKSEIRGDGRERLAIRVEGNDLVLGEALIVRFLRGVEVDDHLVTVEVDPTRGELEAELDFRPQERGDGLPFDVDSVEEIVGIEVQVLRAGTPIRTTTVPMPE